MEQIKCLRILEDTLVRDEVTVVDDFPVSAFEDGITFLISQLSSHRTM